MDKIKAKFFNDPEWSEIEKLLMDYVNPLMDINDLSDSLPAAEYKAEIIARKRLYENLLKFFAQTGMVSTPDEHKRTTFK